MSTIPAAVTQAQFAVIANVKPSYVTALKKADRLVLDAEGRVLVRESLERMEATRDPAKAAVAARHAAARGASVPVPAVDEVGPEPEPTTAGFQHWRERNEKAKALAAERENAIAEGKLMAADDVAAQVSNAMTVLRNSLERLPDILGPQLAAEQSEARCRGLVAEAVELLLEETSRRFAAIAGEGA